MTTNFTTAVEIEVIGVITKEPEMSYTPAGLAKTVVSVYHHEYSGKDAATGKAVKATQWFRLTFWGKDAENVNQYAHVKDILVAKGKLTFDKATGGNRMWTSNTDGTTKSTYEVSAHSVTIISMSGATAGAVIAPDDFEDTTGGAGFAPSSFGQTQPQPQVQPQGGFTTPVQQPAPVYAQPPQPVYQQPAPVQQPQQQYQQPAPVQPQPQYVQQPAPVQPQYQQQAAPAQPQYQQAPAPQQQVQYQQQPVQQQPAPVAPAAKPW